MISVRHGREPCRGALGVDDGASPGNAVQKGAVHLLILQRGQNLQRGQKKRTLFCPSLIEKNTLFVLSHLKIKYGDPQGYP